MARFTNAILLTQRQVQKNGRSIVIVFPTTISKDINKPYLGKIESVDTKTVIGVFLNQKRNDQAGQTTSFPVLVAQGEKHVLIAAGDITPKEMKTATKIEDRGITWKIVDVRIVDPGDDAIMYDVQVNS